MAGDAQVSSAQVAPYVELVERLARPFVGRFDSERDDLVQEGLIKVFQALAKEQLPAKQHIINGMRDWVRVMEYQTRYRRMTEISLEEYQAALLEQEELESTPYGWDKSTGGIDYLDTSELQESGS